jgi:hypothetical protein
VTAQYASGKALSFPVLGGLQSKDLLLLLTSNDYQGSPDQVIEEGNSSVSCWISKVASTTVVSKAIPGRQPKKLGLLQAELVPLALVSPL